MRVWKRMLRKWEGVGASEEERLCERQWVLAWLIVEWEMKTVCRWPNGYFDTFLTLDMQRILRFKIVTVSMMIYDTHTLSLSL